MRVISGSARGRKLLSPDGLNTRPTTDRVKESIFNIIQFRFPSNAVLDLFAGSGALGIEALSRGSESATFIDMNKDAIDTILKNLENTHLKEKALVKQIDCIEYLKFCCDKFDIIFLDPPYNKGFLNNIFEMIHQNRILQNSGIIVVESETYGESVESSEFSCIKQAKYGKTIISVYSYF